MSNTILNVVGEIRAMTSAIGSDMSLACGISSSQFITFLNYGAKKIGSIDVYTKFSDICTIDQTSYKYSVFQTFTLSRLAQQKAVIATDNDLYDHWVGLSNLWERNGNDELTKNTKNIKVFDRVKLI